MKKKKLRLLADIEGKSVDEMLELASWDSIAPGICRVRACDYTTEVEPDQREGWCEECDKGTVVSCLVLAGVI